MKLTLPPAGIVCEDGVHPEEQVADAVPVKIGEVNVGSTLYAVVESKFEIVRLTMIG